MPVISVTSDSPITRGSPPAGGFAGDRGGVAPLLVVVDTPDPEPLADLHDLAVDRLLLVAIPFPRPGGPASALGLWCGIGRTGAHRAAVTRAVTAVLSGYGDRYRLLDLRFRDGGGSRRRPRRLWAAARRLAAQHHAVLLTEGPVTALVPRDERPAQ